MQAENALNPLHLMERQMRAASRRVTRIDRPWRLLVALRRHLGGIRRARHATRPKLLALDVVFGFFRLDAVDRSFRLFHPASPLPSCAFRPRLPRRISATPPKPFRSPIASPMFESRCCVGTNADPGNQP